MSRAVIFTPLKWLKKYEVTKVFTLRRLKRSATFLAFLCHTALEIRRLSARYFKFFFAFQAGSKKLLSDDVAFQGTLC